MLKKLGVSTRILSILSSSKKAKVRFLSPAGLTWPQLKRGGMVQARVYNQMKNMVSRVDRGEDSGNCRS
jgi:hypothetical protein